MEVILKQKPCLCFSCTLHFNRPFHSERLQLHLCSIKNLWLIYLMGFSLSSLPRELSQLECISIRGSVEGGRNVSSWRANPSHESEITPVVPWKEAKTFVFMPVSWASSEKSVGEMILVIFWKEVTALVMIFTVRLWLCLAVFCNVSDFLVI